MAGLDECNIYSTFPSSERIVRDDSQQETNAGTDIRSIDERFTSSMVRHKEEALDDGKSMQRYISVGVGIASIIAENLLSHPFVVLRRQCQVHAKSERCHIVPVTLIPVLVHLHRRQGITTLWKGLGSTLFIRGITLAVEDLISKFTPWPKELSSHSTLRIFGQHVMLKSLSLAIVTPFYSASLVETVQSDIASEKPGIFDIFREGACRLLSWGCPQKGRMLPVWALVMPTVMYGLLKYLMSMVFQKLSFKIIVVSHKLGQKKQGAVSRDFIAQATIQQIHLTSSLVGAMAADILFFPLETVLHRLHLQGTRTIIDNLDTGYAVTPILTSYEGMADCYCTTLQEEGCSGFYKGFGALILQYMTHFALIKLTKVLMTEVSFMLATKPKQSPSQELSSIPCLTAKSYHTPTGPVHHVSSSYPSHDPDSPYYRYT